MVMVILVSLTLIPLNILAYDIYVLEDQLIFMDSNKSLYRLISPNEVQEEPTLLRGSILKIYPGSVIKQLAGRLRATYLIVLSLYRPPSDSSYLSLADIMLLRHNGYYRLRLILKRTGGYDITICGYLGGKPHKESIQNVDEMHIVGRVINRVNSLPLHPSPAIIGELKILGKSAPVIIDISSGSIHIYSFFESSLGTSTDDKKNINEIIWSEPLNRSIGIDVPNCLSYYYYLNRIKYIYGVSCTFTRYDKKYIV